MSLLFVGDFETGSLSQWGKQTGPSCLINVVTDRVRQGQYAAKFDVFGGCHSDGTWRAELETLSQYRPPAGANHYFGWSTYFDPSFPSLSSDSCLFIQWKDNEGGPGIGMSAFNNRISVDRDPECGWTTPLARGGWHDFVLRIFFANSGNFDLWHKAPSESVLTKKVTNCADDTLQTGGIYLKQGLYRGGSEGGRSILWHDGMRVGTTFEDVVPGGSGGGTTPPPPPPPTTDTTAPTITITSPVDTALPPPPPPPPPPPSGVLTVTMTSPLEGASVVGPMDWRATTSDDAQVSSVRFSVDGVVKFTESNAPWDVTPDPDSTALGAPGSHVLKVEAFNVSGDSLGSDTNNVTFSNPTPPPSGSEITAFAVGDGTSSSDAVAVANLIANANPTEFLYLGDVYETGTASEFTTWNGTWGALKSRGRPTCGNHEYGNRASGYDPYWGARGGGGGQRYYSFTIGEWKIISVSTMESIGAGSTQLNWVINELAAAGTKKLVFGHHPRYSADTHHGDQAQIGALWTAMIGHAMGYVAGHAHDMQRLNPIDGITQFVCGAGGRTRYPINFGDSRLAFGNDSSYGALRLVFNGATVTLAFLSQAGTVLNSSTLTGT